MVQLNRTAYGVRESKYSLMTEIQIDLSSVNRVNQIKYKSFMSDQIRTGRYVLRCMYLFNWLFSGIMKTN